MHWWEEHFPDPAIHCMTTKQGSLTLLLFAGGGAGCRCLSTRSTVPGYLQPVTPPWQIGSPTNPAGMFSPWNTPALSQATSPSLFIRSPSQFLPCWRRMGFPHIPLHLIQDHTMRNLPKTCLKGSPSGERKGVSPGRGGSSAMLWLPARLSRISCVIWKNSHLSMLCKGPILPLQWLPAFLFALKAFGKNTHGSSLQWSSFLMNFSLSTSSSCYFKAESPIHLPKHRWMVLLPAAYSIWGMSTGTAIPF